MVCDEKEIGQAVKISSLQVGRLLAPDVQATSSGFNFRSTRDGIDRRQHVAATMLQAS